MFQVEVLPEPEIAPTLTTSVPLLLLARVQEVTVPVIVLPDEPVRTMVCPTVNVPLRRLTSEELIENVFDPVATDTEDDVPTWATLDDVVAKLVVPPA